MNTDGRKVIVKSMVNYIVGLNIPDLRFKREFAKEGETKSIDFDTLLEGITSLGVRTLFEEGILYIENKQDRIDLGLEEEGRPEKFKVLTRGQILKLLKVDPISKLQETLEISPKEQINRIAEVAIEEKFTDFDKCNLIKKFCGIDIISSVQNINED
jgi:hypothetical protein|nr:MAG TPA: hypothetical protein [Caudoviricetes sp.]